MVAVDTAADRIVATLDIRPPCCMTGQPVKGVPQVSLRSMLDIDNHTMQPQHKCAAAEGSIVCQQRQQAVPAACSRRLMHRKPAQVAQRALDLLVPAPAGGGLCCLCCQCRCQRSVEGPRHWIPAAAGRC